MTPINTLLTAPQAASVLGLTRQAITYRARKRLMPAVRTERGFWLFTLDAVAIALAEQKTKAAAYNNN